MRLSDKNCFQTFICLVQSFISLTRKVLCNSDFMTQNFYSSDRFYRHLLAFSLFIQKCCHYISYILSKTSYIN